MSTSLLCFLGERKRKKRDGKGSTGASNRPKHFPFSERQQLALLMQMTAEEKNGMFLVVTHLQSQLRTPNSNLICVIKQTLKF